MEVVFRETIHESGFEPKLHKPFCYPRKKSRRSFTTTIFTPTEDSGLWLGPRPNVMTGAHPHGSPNSKEVNRKIFAPLNTTGIAFAFPVQNCHTFNLNVPQSRAPLMAVTHGEKCTVHDSDEKNSKSVPVGLCLCDVGDDTTLILICVTPTSPGQLQHTRCDRIGESKAAQPPHPCWSLALFSLIKNKQQTKQTTKQRRAAHAPASQTGSNQQQRLVLCQIFTQSRDIKGREFRTRCAEWSNCSVFFYNFVSVVLRVWL